MEKTKISKNGKHENFKKKIEKWKFQKHGKNENFQKNGTMKISKKKWKN